jgi:hypothetical protein
MVEYPVQRPCVFCGAESPYNTTNSAPPDQWNNVPPGGHVCDVCRQKVIALIQADRIPALHYEDLLAAEEAESWREMDEGQARGDPPEAWGLDSW